MDTHIRALPAPTTEQVFLVSPPVTPPWLNGSVLLARDLATQGDRYRYRVLGSKGQTGLPRCATLVEEFYSPQQGGLTRNLRLVARLLRPDGCKIQHFFFAPHKRASSMARLTLGLNRKRSVHTLPSLPAEGADLPSLMFADRIVVLSECSAIYLRSAGIEDVRVVRPGIPVPETLMPKDELRTRITSSGLIAMDKGHVFLYAGDLEFSNGAETFARAAIETLREKPNATFLFACRPKTPASLNALTRVKNILKEAHIGQHCHFLGVVSDMETLLGAVDAVVMPVDSLYAKVDMPFVLLQAMALGTPVIVSDLGPLTELAGLGGGAWVVKQSNPSATANAMIELANDQAKADRLGRAARSTIALNFRPQDMVHRYESIYDELI
jgi:glycosyltransferase involved in cell wall biosynthesis